MAAPTNAVFVKKVLANSEPSTHGPYQLRRPSVFVSDVEGEVAVRVNARSVAGSWMF